jgi:Fe-S cluster assembly scaffold protein SufB
MGKQKLGLSKKEAERIETVGFDFKEKSRCGSFFQKDNQVLYFNQKNKDIEIMPTSLALKKYSWLKKYLWKAVDKNKDKYTKEVARHPQEGYFIRVKKGQKIEVPVQACLYLKKKKLHQRVHNLIIAQEGSFVNIITGCTIDPQASFGLHIGISEFFVERGATVYFTMIHNWAKETIVRPRTGAILEKNSRFISNYICKKEAKDIQMFPVAYLQGEGAIAKFNSILVAKRGSLLDVGAGVFLSAKKTKAEIRTKALSEGGKIISRGRLIGEASETKAHLECQGLIVGKNGQIEAIPEIKALTIGTDLSHEAAIGKIAQEEIDYLMARGISYQEAVSLIVKGFLSFQNNNFLKEFTKEII